MPVNTEFSSGCLICGADIRYSDVESRLRCAYCGVEISTSVACANGHFVCDACHRAPAHELMERFCVASSSREPVSMALTLMHDPRVKLHGPEHHFLVPAVLLTAFSNATGRSAEERAMLIRKARSRAEDVKGGFCGTHGSCGAGVGTGIFVSVATGATSLSRSEWRLSNLMTSESLHSIAVHGGPRCCKRTTFLALRSAVAFARRELGVALPEEEARCEWSGKNKECLKMECPFFSTRRAP